jgi:glucose-1-phosphate adenylyltransferase
VYCFQTSFLVHQLVSDSKKRTSHDFGKNILPNSLSQGLVRSCPLEAICPDEKPYWRDVGTLDSYYRATMDLLDTPPAFELRDPRWPQGSRFFEWLPAVFPGTTPAGRSTRDERNLIACACDVSLSTIGRSVMSQGVSIGEGSVIQECILFPGVKVGRRVQLTRVIVDEGVEIPDGVTIGPKTDRSSFTVSPEGIAVVPSGYRFDEPSAKFVDLPLEEELAGRPTSARAAKDRRKTRV